jgi:biotin-(acetyl-CoA carboxylase) ligase
MMGIAFPPLLTGLAVAGDPFLEALEAAEDAEPGTVFHSPAEETMRAAVLLAPEVPLREAAGVSFAVALGLSDALGALAPPEVGVHLEWPDRVRVNGGLCGRLRLAASTRDPDAEPDWLIVGIEVSMLPEEEREPGERAEVTCLREEGCGGITVAQLVEAWARHMMNWLHVYLTDGFAPLHEAWRAKAWRLGETVSYPAEGGFVGLDEWGGMILKDGARARILPLTDYLERP